MSDYIQLARVICYEEDHKPNMHKDGFYTLCLKDPKKNIGLRKKSIKVCHHLPTFKTDDVSIDYLCSDFVRFCLSLFKNRSNIDNGEMSLIPKQPIPISQELQDYIKEFLPDFYGTRNNVK